MRNMRQRTAIVVGGGIGGLAAALGLRRIGYRVRLLEQAKALTEVGAAIGLNPNATGMLFAMGLKERLSASAVEPRAAIRRRWQDGRELFRADLSGATAEYGYPFWFVHRGDLQTALFEEAIDPSGAGEPISVELRTRVTSYSVEDNTVTADGMAGLSADVVVAADGIRSTIRRTVFDSVVPEYSGQTVYRTQIPAELLARSRSGREVLERAAFETWLGPDGHVVHAPFRERSMLNVGGCFYAAAIGGDVQSAPAHKEDFLVNIADWSTDLQEVVAAGPSFHRYDLYTIPPLKSWVSSSTCLIGDAAHPMLPYLGQGAAQALEDAECLAAVLDGVDAGSIPAALADYDLLRRERATRVQQVSNRNGDVFHLHDGPEQRARDARIAEGASDSDISRWVWTYQNPTQAVAGLRARPEAVSTGLDRK